MKELLDSLNDNGSLLVKLVIGIGVAVVFSYCAFSINFFPVGLTLGDSLVFLFIALGFGVFYLLWLALGYFILYSIAYPFTEKLGKNDSARFLTFFLGGIFLFMLSWFSYSIHDWGYVIAPLVSGAILLITTFFWNPAPAGSSVQDIQERKKTRVVIILLAVFIVPLIGMKAVSRIVDSSFGLFGINQKNVSLVLSEKNHAIVSGVASGLEVPLFGCELVKGSTRIIDNVNVLWHGIGDIILIDLLRPDENGFKSVARLELESEGTSVLKPLDSHASFNACINLESDTLFDSYESIPSVEGKKQLDALINKINIYLKSSKLEITSASITGYTDRRPVSKDGDTNYDLSRRRAKSVFDTLSPLFNENVKKLVNVSGKGMSNPKSKCDKIQYALELNECLAVDRRVEVNFKFRGIGSY